MGYVISYNAAGLGNRLKCLVSAMRVAEKCSKTLILCWPKNSSVNCSFSDLFENKFIEIKPEEMEILNENSDIDKQNIMIDTWKLLVFPEDNIPSNFTRVYPSFTGTDIDCEYDRIPLAVREKVLPYIKQLVPKRHILDEIKNYSKNFTDHTVSINIRSWPDYSPRKSLFDIKNVYALLNKMDCSNFFVTCDSSEILEKIIKRYGKRVLYYRKYVSEKEVDGIEKAQDALCDLLLLSKNSKLLASYLSTFSEMVWWFGGCTAEVKLIPVKSYFYKRVVIWPPNMMVFCILWSRYIPIPYFIADWYVWLMMLVKKVKTVTRRQRGYTIFS